LLPGLNAHVIPEHEERRRLVIIRLDPGLVRCLVAILFDVHVAVADDASGPGKRQLLVAALVGIAVQVWHDVNGECSTRMTECEVSPLARLQRACAKDAIGDRSWEPETIVQSTIPIVISLTPPTHYTTMIGDKLKAPDIDVVARVLRWHGQRGGHAHRRVR
jgi:hypothetical protein